MPAVMKGRLFVISFTAALLLTSACGGDGQLAATPTPGAPATGKIAFHSDRDGNEEVYVMNADGSDQTKLINSAANEFFPSWSPDGTRIAFFSDRDGNIEIYVMNADGSGQTKLINNAANNFIPAWSPAP
ncbi:MAG: TolB family protein [Dehalococcoidia bacterium]